MPAGAFWAACSPFSSLRSRSVVLTARDDRRLRTLALIALVCLVGAQALFWIFTYPANAATANWTVQPEDWQALRLRWEYSHAAGALLQLAAMACLSLGAVRDNRRPPSS